MPTNIMSRSGATSTTDWRHGAVCRDVDPELFFPTGDSGPALAQAEAAKAVCHGCPAIEACLAWALATGQDDGISGGLDPAERRALRRKTLPVAPQRPAASAPGLGSTRGSWVRLGSQPGRPPCVRCTELHRRNPARHVRQASVRLVAYNGHRKHLCGQHAAQYSRQEQAVAS